MKGFKGFDKNMRCRCYQYEEGREEAFPEAALCKSGGHFCEAPIDCLVYYAPCNGSVYHEVEAEEVSEETSPGDSKRVAKRLKIGARLTIPGLVQAQFEYVSSKAQERIEKGNAEAASAGSYGAASAGENGAASAGYRGAASAGENGAASAGYRGAASAGSYGAASAGSYGAASAGENGAASAGSYGAAASRGSCEVGKQGVAVARGNEVKVKGGLGSILVLAEEKRDSYDIACWKAFVIDGKEYKPDTYYCLKDDEIVEWKEDKDEKNH